MIVFLGNAGKIPDKTSPILIVLYALAILVLSALMLPFLWTLVWFCLWITPLTYPTAESWWTGLFIFIAIIIVLMISIFKTTK